MSQKVSDVLASVQPRMAAAQRCTERNAVAEDFRRAVGQVVDRAIERAHLTKQDVSDRMGFTDPKASAVSRWCTGMERPHFDRLLAIEELCEPLLVELALRFGATVSTRIAFPERRRA